MSPGLDVQGQDASGMRLDVYTGTALNDTESPDPAKPNRLVDLLNGSQSVLAYARANSGGATTAEAAVSVAKPDPGPGDVMPLGGVTEAVPQDYPSQFNEMERRLGSMRPLARSEGPARTAANTPVPRVETQTAREAPAVSMRPVARPDLLLVGQASVQPPAPAPEIAPAQPVVTRAAVPAPQPEIAEATPQESTPAKRGRDLSGRRLGTILGLFETSSRRWALVEGEAGRISILEPGDMIGDGIVSSISNGTLVISVGAAFKEYYAGDRL